MVAIADGIDFIADVVQGKALKMNRAGMRSSMAFCYIAFAFIWMFAWGRISSFKFSATLTCASAVQCLGFALLSVKVHGSKSVTGLSSKMLELYVLFYGSRLTSTALRNGYLPQDATGDYMYQFLDMCSLLLVVQLLYCVHKKFSHTYHDEHDNLALLPIAAPCFILALLVHGNLNKCFFFDTCWAFSCNLESLVLVPQLWMMAVKGGKVDTVTAHFVACATIAGVMSFVFWWYNYVQVDRRSGGIAGKVIIGANVLKLVLCGDFAYYYAMALFGGLDVVLPNREKELL